jgi:addiction module HigA family antidote
MTTATPNRTPGDILRRDYLDRYQITQRALADHIGCDTKVINSIVNGRSSVTADMALKLAASLQTEPDLWLDAQKQIDLQKAAKLIGKLPKPIARSQMALPL